MYSYDLARAAIHPSEAPQTEVPIDIARVENGSKNLLLITAIKNKMDPYDFLI